MTCVSRDAGRVVAAGASSVSARIRDGRLSAWTKGPSMGGPAESEARDAPPPPPPHARTHARMRHGLGSEIGGP